MACRGGLSPPPNWIQMFVCVAQHVSVQCVVCAINKFASKNEIKDGGGFPGWEREILSLCVSLCSFPSLFTGLLPTV
jgi:hypothetical protein